VKWKGRGFVSESKILRLLALPLRMVAAITPSRLGRALYYLRAGRVDVVMDRLKRLLRIGTVERVRIALYPSADRPGRLEFPVFDQPKVSIVIPVFNQWETTRSCLISILENAKGICYEVIVADDGSTDETRNLKDHVSNVRRVVHDKNLGFLRNCNSAAKVARGEFLLFLNNDTNVQPGWLENLLDVAENDNRVGLVGPMLIYPDGRLQEAGGIIWQDASGWNYGRLDYPERPEYNYLKEVDYISGACILVRKTVWDEIGGFDDRFAPAYYEDADLAFEIRRHGYKVIYQPLSKVVHFEGISNGTDVSVGVKAHQLANQPKFREKWRDVLDADHAVGPQDLFFARDRSGGKRTLLFIDHYVPLYDQDAGSRSVFHYLRLMAEMGYNIKFVGDNFVGVRPYTTTLQQLGIEVFYGAACRRNWGKWLSSNGKYIDYVLLSRPHIAMKYLPTVKRHTRAKRIYLGHDLHFLRESRQGDIGGHAFHEKAARRWEKVEGAILHDVSVGYFVSEFEVSEIRRRWPDVSARVIPISLLDESEIHRTGPPFEDRKGLLFVGSFMHEPNVDGLRWFIEDILPAVRASLPGAILTVVGGAAPAELSRLAGADIVFRGWVSDEELAGLYRSCRVVVAPLRFGAGVKGKVVEAMCQGVPVATTSIGAEGITAGGEALLVADTPEAFADGVGRLYSTPELWQQFAECATQSVARHVSVSAAREIFAADMALEVEGNRLREHGTGNQAWPGFHTTKGGKSANSMFGRLFAVVPFVCTGTGAR
jgi:GT2 family glycosyltransferase